MLQSCFYHIRTLRHIRGVSDLPIATAIALALISSQLDYANSILYGSPSKNPKCKSCYTKTPCLSLVDTVCEHHWLPVQWRIMFKHASFTFKVMHTGDPLYLSHLIRCCPSRVLRPSSSFSILQVPHTNLIFSSRSFHSAALGIWNPLPDSLRSSGSFHSFSQHLKTHLYQAPFNTPLVVYSSTFDSLVTIGTYMYKWFYLLTYSCLQCM